MHLLSQFSTVILSIQLIEWHFVHQFGRKGYLIEILFVFLSREKTGLKGVLYELILALETLDDLR